jgi:hypothetical protein
MLSPRLVLLALLCASVLLALMGTADESDSFDSAPVFREGEHNYTCFRIPALLRLPTGEIALYTEARKDSCADQGHIDLVYRISADNGTSWGPMRHLYGESTPDKQVAIGNPAPVVVGGKVLLAFCRNNHQVLTLVSNDAGGRDWPSTPTEVTEQVFGHPFVHWVRLSWETLGLFLPRPWRGREGRALLPRLISGLPKLILPIFTCCVRCLSCKLIGGIARTCTRAFSDASPPSGIPSGGHRPPRGPAHLAWARANTVQLGRLGRHSNLGR